MDRRPDRTAAMVELYVQGATYKAIGERYGVSAQRVGQLIGKEPAVIEAREARPIKHGRRRYTSHGCRCEICCEANRAYSQERRRKVVNSL